jgi:hypothetical protein
MVISLMLTGPAAKPAGKDSVSENRPRKHSPDGGSDAMPDGRTYCQAVDVAWSSARVPVYLSWARWVG